ncbi:hypothetical protein ERO13_A09G022032v2 [Gossypium hirsutum]|nr:hypothetical protein ERO13_A09G022032v2 [Gossypium hirsutum]
MLASSVHQYHCLSTLKMTKIGMFRLLQKIRNIGSRKQRWKKKLNWKEEEKNMKNCSWQKGYERIWVIKSNGERDIISLLCASVFSLRHARNLTSRMVQLKDASLYSFSYCLYFPMISSRRILRISCTILSVCL